MADTSKDEHLSKAQLLELYKLHAELADRLNQRREAINRLYVTISTGLLVLFGAVIPFASKDWPIYIILYYISLIGVKICRSWQVTMIAYHRSYQIKINILCGFERFLREEFCFFSLEKKLGISLAEKEVEQAIQERKRYNLKRLLFEFLTMPFQLLFSPKSTNNTETYHMLIIHKRLPETFHEIFLIASIISICSPFLSLIKRFIISMLTLQS